MSIQFNGKVTINGDVEMYDNGSMKISGNTYNIDISELEGFIEKTVPNSINKEEYLQAAKEINGGETDKSKLKQAFEKIVSFTKESGKAVWIGGLQGVAKEVAQEISKFI